MLGLLSSFSRRRRIFLHVGLPKCGSTSIQRHMAEHEAAHLARGVCYPRAHRARDGYRNHLPLARMAPGDLAGAVRDIVAEAADCHTIVLSCEHWANALPRCNLSALCEILARDMPCWDLQVVAYFRNPFEFVESSYAQCILAGLFQISRDQFYKGERPSIDKFLAEFEAGRGFPLYSNLGFVRLMQEHLPRSALNLRSIEPRDLKSGGMLADFCRLVRLPRPDQALCANTRLSNRKLAELEYVQTLIDQGSYVALRDRLIKHEFPRDPAADDRRATTLHIGSGLAKDITHQINDERTPLARIFATRTKGLCTVPTRDWVRHDVLSARDHDSLARFVAKHTT